jgi:hypothetical protein
MNIQDLFFAYHEANDEAKRLRAELIAQLKTDERLKNVNEKNVDSIDFWDYGFEYRGSLVEEIGDDDYRFVDFVDVFHFSKDGFYHNGTRKR